MESAKAGSTELIRPGCVEVLEVAILQAPVADPVVDNRCDKVEARVVTDHAVADPVPRCAKGAVQAKGGTAVGQVVGNTCAREVDLEAEGLAVDSTCAKAKGRVAEDIRVAASAVVVEAVVVDPEAVVEVARVVAAAGDRVILSSRWRLMRR
jgi:hypothetical protein